MPPDRDKLTCAVSPRIGGDAFNGLHSSDGDDLGEATYAQMIHADQERSDDRWLTGVCIIASLTSTEAKVAV